MFRTKTAAITLLISVLGVSTLHAECLWDDSEGLRPRFERYVSTYKPAKCDISFHHQEAFATDNSTVKYEMMVATSSSCLKKLATKLKAAQKAGKPAKCSRDVAKAVEVYDSGDMAIMFTFKVSKYRAKEAGWTN